MNQHIQPMTGETAATIYAQGLTAKFKDSTWPYNPEFSVAPYNKSAKYLMIVNDGCPNPSDEDTPLYRRHRSVHAYVDRATGAVYKAAGWKGGPVKSKGVPDVRYPNVWEALVSADRNGSYLYKQ
jgi:hypothetical protein